MIRRLSTRLLPLIAVAALAACVPVERRLLVLDLALADHALIAPTLRPWADAGYAVDYRPFFPHLTRADLTRYGAVIVLGGRGPATDALDLSDLELLGEGVARGMVAVLAYAGDGEGALDRWTMNRWLHSVGAGVAIDEWPLEDTTAAAPAVAEPQPPAEPVGGALGLVALRRFPAGRNHALTLRDPAHALARSTGDAFARPPDATPSPRPHAAVVAATRLQHGLIIVASRHLLGALGPEVRAATISPLQTDSLAGTRLFLRALVRWTRRPAEWAHVPSTDDPRTFVLAGAPAPLSRRPALDEAPEGAGPPAETETANGDSAATTPPVWARRAGFRLAWSRAPLGRGDEFLSAQTAALDSLFEFLDAAGFNVLATPVTPAMLDDTGRADRLPRTFEAAAWRRALDRMATTSVRWLPTLSFDRLRRIDRALTPRCLLDDSVWTAGVRPAFRALALHARQRSGVVTGITIDAGLPPDEPPAWACDGDVAIAVRALGRDSTTVARVLALPPTGRYDWLLASGQLGPFFANLETALAERVARARDEARRVHPGLLFVVRVPAPPADWRALGLMRGLATRDAPVVVWSTEPDARELVLDWRARGINALHVTGLSAERVPARAWPRLRTAAFVASAGFALGPLDRVLAAPRTAEGPVPVDSLARLLRHLSRER